MKKLMKCLLVSGFLLTSYNVVANEKQSIEQELATISTKQKSIEESLSKTIENIDNTKKQLGFIEKDIAKTKKIIKKQAREMQMKQKTSLISALIDSKSFSEQLKLVTSQSKMFDSSTTHFTTLKTNEQKKKELLVELEKSKTELTSEQTKLKDLNQTLSTKLNDITAKEQQEQIKKQQQAIASVSSVVTDTISQTQATPENMASSTSYGPHQANEAFERIIKELNLPESEIAIWRDIITKESGWQTTVWNGAGSGAYGLGQALPAGKMAPYGADYMTNPYTQLKWMYNYVVERYGSFAGVNWYSRGWY